MTKHAPRPYQIDAHDAAVKAMDNGETPYLSLVAGSGKSLVAAMLSMTYLARGHRVIQIVPSAELVTQNRSAIADTTLVGRVCAKLGYKCTNRPVTIGTPVSLLGAIRDYSLDTTPTIIIIDECHLVSPSPDSSIRRIITLLSPAAAVGLSATPYRQGQGYLDEHPKTGTRLFTTCAYKTSISDMIDQGYLSPIITINHNQSYDIDTTGIKIINGDYDKTTISMRYSAIVKAAVTDMTQAIINHNLATTLVFVATVEAAEQAASHMTLPYRIITGKTPKADRDASLQWLRHGTDPHRVIINVSVLATGYDYPALDCVVLLRAIYSLSLYVQATCRVIRVSPDKQAGHIIDYGTNTLRHGPIDTATPKIPSTKQGLAPFMVCSTCGEHTPIARTITQCSSTTHTAHAISQPCKDDQCDLHYIVGSRTCPAGHSTDTGIGNYTMHTAKTILAVNDTHTIDRIDYAKHISNKTGSVSLRIDYYAGSRRIISQYLSLDHANPRVVQLSMATLASHWHDTPQSTSNFAFFCATHSSASNNSKIDAALLLSNHLATSAIIETAMDKDGKYLVLKKLTANTDNLTPMTLPVMQKALICQRNKVRIDMLMVDTLTRNELMSITDQDELDQMINYFCVKNNY